MITQEQLDKLNDLMYRKQEAKNQLQKLDEIQPDQTANGTVRLADARGMAYTLYDGELLALTLELAKTQIRKRVEAVNAEIKALGVLKD